MTTRAAATRITAVPAHVSAAATPIRIRSSLSARRSCVEITTCSKSSALYSCTSIDLAPYVRCLVASQCTLLGLDDIPSHAVGRQTTESRAVNPAHIEPVTTCSCFLRPHAAITGNNAATDCMTNEFRCGRNEHRLYPLSFVIAP